jgi:hypothetical protein
MRSVKFELLETEHTGTKTEVKRKNRRRPAENRSPSFAETGSTPLSGRDQRPNPAPS